MSKLLIAPQAQRDLESITDYLSERNANAAMRYLERFLEKFQVLAASPGIGERRDDLRPGLKIHTFDAYVICFRVRQERTEIVTVLHGARDWESLIRST